MILDTLDDVMEQCVVDMNACWLWVRSTNSGGYAWAKEGPVGKSHGRAIHRVSYEIANGKIPDGLVIDHVCRVHRCVNPKHLRAVTSRENIMAPGSIAPAKRKAELTHCIRGHLLAPPNLLTKRKYRNGQRECRACHNMKRLALYHRRRAEAKK